MNDRYLEGSLDLTSRELDSDFEVTVSLGNLENINGSLYAGDTSLRSLGALSRVSGIANFDNTLIKDLGVLNYVGRDLILSDSRVFRVCRR